MYAKNVQRFAKRAQIIVLNSKTSIVKDALKSVVNVRMIAEGWLAKDHEGCDVKVAPLMILEQKRDLRQLVEIFPLLLILFFRDLAFYIPFLQELQGAIIHPALHQEACYDIYGNSDYGD